jgi:2,3-bisphosphoglycerate-independent phosphoglycerate mutase
MGLLSDGGVHSHQRHLYALLEMAARRRVERVFVHAFTDGRDTSPFGAGAQYVPALEQVMTDVGRGRIATVCGRYYAMDRDRRWQRTERAYDALTAAIGRAGLSARQLVDRSYTEGVTDEFVEPGVVTNPDGSPVATIQDADSVIFFNFRADRARQLTRALAFHDFDGFVRKARPSVALTTLTVYDATFALPEAFPPQTFARSLGEQMPEYGLTNLRLAETEKYAHVTYFFNCGVEPPYPGEDRTLVPSPKVATYDLQPEMSAVGITNELVADLEARRHDVIVCNFANADMVGHTGVLEAAVAAVETLDRCLGRIVPAVQAAGGVLLVTADHGNAEQMWDAELNAPHTAHTSNPVPLVLVDDRARGMRLADGWLRDVAPTILGVMELDPPKEMTGRDLRDRM